MHKLRRPQSDNEWELDPCHTFPTFVLLYVRPVDGSVVAFFPYPKSRG